MTTLRNVAIGAATLIALVAYAKTPPSADEAAIRAINPAWFKAYNARDSAAIAALYSEDAVVNAPGAPAVRGRAAIKEAMAKDIASSAAGGLSFHPGAAPEFGVSGDLGWEWNTFTVTDKSGATVDSGKYITVYAKKGGKWSIIRDTWNSDVPAAAPVAAEPTK